MKQFLPNFLLILCFFALFFISSAEESDQAYRLLNGYDAGVPVRSYAFSSEYEIRAVGKKEITGKDADWEFPDQYELTLYRLEGDEQRYLGLVKADQVYCFSDGNQFFLFLQQRQDDISTRDELSAMYALNPHTEEFRHLCDIPENSEDISFFVQDIVNNGKDIYLISAQHIRHLNTDTLKMQVIYETEGMILSLAYRNHAKTYENEIIFYEYGKGILGVNNESREVRKLIYYDDEKYPSRAELSLGKSRNSFWVEKNELIFRDTHRMYALNLDTGDARPYFYGTFNVFFSDGLGLYIDMDDNGLGTYYYQPDLNTLTLLGEALDPEQFMIDYMKCNIAQEQ